ncbi:hypothetical protein TWF594_002464 [Orbilia oligospora]|nr:hypothetical protein TWF594_002464 [Orbilia oligospora]
MQMDLAHINSHAVIAEHKSLWVRQSSRIQSKHFTSIVGFRPRTDKALENIRYPRMDWRNLQHYDTILGQRMLATCLPFPYVVAGIVIIGYFPIIILLLAAWCHPLEAYWTTSLMSDGHRACFTFIPHNIAVLVVNTVADLLVLAVPIPMIWKVKVSHLRKFIIIAIFGIGIFNIVACICARSALLVWQHYNNNNQLQINFNRNYVVWMAREVSSAVIVGTYTTMYL